ncbi:MAG: copper chaperone PCu(A)C [Caldilineaceae bacterium]|nr:copper chaperone PCu(A)C [Caldilineaceae bacterium]
MKSIKCKTARASRMALFFVSILLITACGAQNNGAATNKTQVKLSAPPAGGQLAVAVTDAGGAPITDATVSLEGNMNHAGMAPVMTDGVADDADGAADGVYHLPFEFTMNGDWIITVSVKLADGATETHDIDLTVTGDDVQIHQAAGADSAAAGDMASGDMTSDEMATDDMATEEMSSDDMDMDHDMDMADQGPIHVTDAWVRASLPMTDNTALYFTLHNTTDETVRLTSVSVDGLTAEMHESIIENGVARMEARPDGFEIPPGEHLMLAEGGKHVMLMGIKEPLAAGTEIEVTLEFEGADPVTFMAPVSEEAGPAMDHSQHGG